MCSSVCFGVTFCELSAYNSSFHMPWVIMLHSMFIYLSWSTLPNDEPKQQTKTTTNKYSANSTCSTTTQDLFAITLILFGNLIPLHEATF